jgi:hypothetical protein
VVFFALDGIPTEPHTPLRHQDVPQPPDPAGKPPDRRHEPPAPHPPAGDVLWDDPTGPQRPAQRPMPPRGLASTPAFATVAPPPCRPQRHAPPVSRRRARLAQPLPRFDDALSGRVNATF